MLLVGQWILFGLVVCLGLVLLWHAAKYLVNLILVFIVAACVILGLHRYSMLPEPFQAYVDELCSTDIVLKTKEWVKQQIAPDSEEATTKTDQKVKS